MATQPQSQQGSFWRSRAGFACLVFIGVAAFYLFTEHTAHVFGFLPYALFLLCPLMHLFMHGGHGGADTHAGHPSSRVEDARS
ncbi:MAG: DUF2933 domain-containing protein [Chloroflexota bacterium]